MPVDPNLINLNAMPFVPAMYHGGERRSPIGLFVVHYAHLDGVDATVNYFSKGCKREHRKVSSTFVAGNDGRIVRMLYDNQIPYTNGRSFALAPGSDRIVNWSNSMSITVEIGVLQNTPYTDRCYQAIAQLCLHYICNYKWSHILRIVGHEHISPLRKVDPGPLWDWRRFFVEFLGVKQSAYSTYLSYLDDVKGMPPSNKRMQVVKDAFRKIATYDKPSYTLMD
jgi:N-acetyl-anhydromuramyl-L-alanine amidase AmpD